MSAGDDQPGTVLLIHAVGNDLTYWDRQIEGLSPHYRVIAYDLAGHGSSTGEPEDWTFQQAVSIVTDLIEHVSIKPVHLVGISFGGMIAQHSVLARPDLVRSLTLIGTDSHISKTARAGLRAKAQTVRTKGVAAVLQGDLDSWFTPAFQKLRPDVIDRVSKTVLASNAAAQAKIWEIIAEFDVQERLEQITCPTLILGGEEDPSTPPGTMFALAAGILGARVVIIPSASHLVTIEKPDAVNAELLKFLEAVDRDHC